MNTLKPRIASLLQQLNERVFEKEHIVALALLSAVAGESIFLLGPPGVAKSMVGRRLKLAFRNFLPNNLPTSYAAAKLSGPTWI